MTTKNDITGDTLKSKPANDNYRNSKFWDNVEKKKKEAESCNTATSAKTGSST